MQTFIIISTPGIYVIYEPQQWLASSAQANVGTVAVTWLISVSTDHLKESQLTFFAKKSLHECDFDNVG